MRKEEGDFMGHLLGDIQLGITTLLDQKRVCFHFHPNLFSSGIDLAFLVHLITSQIRIEFLLILHNPDLGSLLVPRITKE